MSSLSAIPALDNTIGALYLGVMLSMALWGAGTVQMYFYYTTYHARDEIWIKMLVFVVWLFDAIHQGLITYTCYVYLVTEYGNIAYLAVLEKSLMIMVLFTAIICFLVQTFLTTRIWRIVLAQLVTTLVYFGKAIHFTEFGQLLLIKNLTRSINVVNAVADAAIAGALVFLLRRSRTGFRHSESVINRLILFAISTGLLTGLTAIVCLIMNLAFPTTFLYILFYLMTSRLYMNSLLATLNSRKSVRTRFGNSIQSIDTSNDISMDQFRPQPLSINTSVYGSTTGQKVEIGIEIETDTTYDNTVKTDLEGDGMPDFDIESTYPTDLDKHHTIKI
ncbi:hypothetical protein EW145_g4852 [Phellinidium pouzarii]|uniref:DUF6534 domain-containing protein n=1 Tax=Phellinidium pouzarii TaxID=167371 RepID=A0A4S4L289_9AGAM|nr:hypothetical protein EW145_g4852 [Phellinidium pouzarii]